jgi:Protein of unknown function, DUF481
VVTPRLQAFGQHSYLRDLFSGIVHRNLTDGGLSYLVVPTGRNTHCADTGLGYLKSAVNWSHLLRYVDEPVAGFEQTDTITSAALVLSF